LGCLQNTKQRIQFQYQLNILPSLRHQNLPTVRDEIHPPMSASSILKWLNKWRSTKAPWMMPNSEFIGIPVPHSMKKKLLLVFSLIVHWPIKKTI
jgi:hypothetical protein